MGGCHLIHLIRFEDGTKWIARFQLDPPSLASAKQLQSEVDTMALIRNRTKIPLPRVFGFDTHQKTGIGVPFMIMEYLPGIVAMDADGGYHVHHGEIAARYKPNFYKNVANIQVEMASLRLSKIGSVFKRSDGTFDVGPLPKIGGPFETATAFFRAWASTAKFPSSEKYVRELMKGGPVEEVLSAINTFPARIKAIAGNLSSYDKGPFPIYHPDLYHSNIVVDEKFKILGVIDWQGACTVPWELVEHPLFLATVPRAMDAEFNYDEHGQPKDADTKQRWKERADYVQMVKSAEACKKTDATLSRILSNADVQGLADAIKVYHDPGKLGYYNRILEPFKDKHRENS